MPSYRDGSSGPVYDGSVSDEKILSLLILGFTPRFWRMYAVKIAPR